MNGYYLDDHIAKTLESHNVKFDMVIFVSNIEKSTGHTWGISFIKSVLVQMLKNHKLNELQRTNIHCILILNIIKESQKIVKIDYLYKECIRRGIQLNSKDIKFTMGELERKNYIKFVKGYSIK